MKSSPLCISRIELQQATKTVSKEREEEYPAVSWCLWIITTAGAAWRGNLIEIASTMFTLQPRRVFGEWNDSDWSLVSVETSSAI